MYSLRNISSTAAFNFGYRKKIYNLSCHKSEQICVKLKYVRNLCSPKQETWQKIRIQILGVVAHQHNRVQWQVVYEHQRSLFSQKLTLTFIFSFYNHKFNAGNLSEQIFLFVTITDNWYFWHEYLPCKTQL
jgi:hypothetical protein